MIPTAASYPVRHAVLRPHQGIEDVAWEGDADPSTTTFGAIDRADGVIVGVATVFPEPAPFDPAEAGVPPGAGRRGPPGACAGWPPVRTSGGGASGRWCSRRSSATWPLKAATCIWCNARVGAVAFYERAGFRTWGDEWVLPPSARTW